VQAVLGQHRLDLGLEASAQRHQLGPLCRQPDYADEASDSRHLRSSVPLRRKADSA
jgi:hypothetical protein